MYTKKIKADQLKYNMIYVDNEYPEGVKLDYVNNSGYGLIKIMFAELTHMKIFNTTDLVEVAIDKLTEDL